MTMNINDKVLHLLNPAVDIGFNISEIADELNIKNAEAKAACLSLIAENKIRTSIVCGRHVYYGKMLQLEVVEESSMPAVMVEPDAWVVVKKRGRPRKPEQVKLDKEDVKLVLQFSNRGRGSIYVDDMELAALNRLNEEVSA